MYCFPFYNEININSRQGNSSGDEIVFQETRDEELLLWKLRHCLCQNSSYSRWLFVHAYRLGCGYKLGFMREIKCALLSKRRRLYRDRGPRCFSSTHVHVHTYILYTYTSVGSLCISEGKPFTLEYILFDEPLRNTHRLTVKFREWIGNWIGRMIVLDVEWTFIT